MASPLSILGAAHGKVVHGRRVDALARAITPLIEANWSVVDVGCGDGKLAGLIAAARPDLSITGYEVLVREEAAIRVQEFDGSRIPLADRSVDCLMMVDVLHHTNDPMVLLREAARVARHAIIIKDHRMSRPLAQWILRFMDWVGNRAHGVALPYNYWPESRWRTAWDELELTTDVYESRLGLYPGPASLLFERGLHFLVRLRIR